jgi:tryptophan halogenase
VAPPVDAGDIERRGERPVNAPQDEAGALADALLREVQALAAPFRHERSFRLAQGSLQANRFLLTVSRQDIAGDALARIRAIGGRLGLPAAFDATLDQFFATTGAVHFGFEAGASGVLLKLYLEQDATQAPAPAAAGERVLQHIACKWNPATGDAVVSRYWWHAGLDEAGIAARLAQVYGDHETGFSAGIARALLELASQRAPGAHLQYLEVDEPGNARRSFDLNVYDAKLRVHDIQPQLAALRDAYGVRPGQFQALYDQVKGRALGHVAGGVHRDGGEFFNIYHAAS